MKRVCAIVLAGAALAAAPPAGAEPVARTVLGVYKAEQIPGSVKDFYFHPLHQHAELPLNYLGLSLEPLEASGPLPDPESLPGVRGVVTWWNTPESFTDPEPFCRWLSRGMKTGWKVVILGKLGVAAKGAQKPTGECAAMLKTLGVEAGGGYEVDALSTSVATQTAVVGFERRPDPSESGVVPLARPLRGSSAQLTLKLDDARWPQTSPVILTPHGGAALDPFALYANEETSPNQFRWVIDPFAFLDRAFGTAGLPRPDATTLSGRRVFMTHVDGDGFFNASELDRAKTSGEVFLEELVEKQPDMPFTLSLIAGYYDLELYRTDDALTLGRRLLRRPNVEPAAHGYAHPLIWRTMEPALKIPRYRPAIAQETVESARLLSRLFLPPERPVGLYLWTGDCLPPENAVALLERAGLLQLGGGGGRLDRRYPSYAYLFPLSRRVGPWRQIYAGGSNEDVYTNLWSGPFYGYRDVLETFERTGAPRRVKPVDVYVHYYSAEKYASLRALEDVYAWARAHPLIPVFAGRYARAASAFFDMRIERLGPRRFALHDGEAIRTVRFDDESSIPDLSSSRGVVGWKREGPALYVSLDESPEREITLTRNPAAIPRLEEANFEVEGWKTANGGASFRKRGWWTSECVLAGLKPRRAYRVEGGGLSSVLQADGEGRLTLKFPESERSGRSADVSVRPS